MTNTLRKQFNLKSIIHRDEIGNITKISTVQVDKPRFHTPAYDEIVLGNKIPAWLRRQAL